MSDSPSENRRFKILLLTPIFRPAKGGAANYFSILASRLPAADEIEKVAVLTQFTRGASLIERLTGGSAYRLLLPRHTIESPGKIYNGIASVLNTLIIFALLVFLRLFLRYNIVHCHSGELFLHGHRNGPLLLVLRFLRYRVVCDVRDLYSVPDNRFFGHAVITASVAIANKVSQSSTVEPRVIPVPLELPPNKKSSKSLSTLPQLPDRPFLLYVGNVTESKGIRDLLTAWKESDKLHEKFDLVIAGPFFRTEKSLLELLRSDSRIHMIGAVEHEIALEIIRRTAAVIVPSPNEGLPRVCLEAMSVGTAPVCHASVRELHEIYPQFTYDSPSPEQLADAILNAAEATDLSNFNIAKYSAEKVADNYIPLYRSLYEAP